MTAVWSCLAAGLPAPRERHFFATSKFATGDVQSLANVLGTTDRSW